MDDSEEEPVCPLCLEELDLTDRHFKPCQCGYQICLWCWHQIMEMAAGEGKCPACRTPYDRNKVTEASQALPEDLTGLLTEKKQKDRQSKASVSASRQHLSSVRVVQRNLVYVIGLPLTLAEEDVLRTNQYFGQYGKIHKISTSRSAAYNAASGPNGPTASAYVNFVREEDAVKCIQAVDGALLEGKLIRACFGTTKYCNSYLKHIPCTNPDCLYLHDIGSHDDSFTKEEMLASKQDYFHNATHPSNYSGKGLPPPASDPASAARPLNIPSSSQQSNREASSTVGSPGPQAALAASSSWGAKSKVAAAAPVPKGPPVAIPAAPKAVRPAGPTGPLTNGPSQTATSTVSGGATGSAKGAFTSHKPSAAVLSGRVINANAQPPPFIAVASRNVEPASGVLTPGTSTATTSMAKTVSAAQAAAAAALSGRPVTPAAEAGASSSMKSTLDPTPKQAAAALAARTVKPGRQVVVGHVTPAGAEEATAGSVAPSVIKTLGTGPIRQGSFVAVAKAAAGVSLGAGSKLILEGSLNAGVVSPLAGESFPTLQAVINQSTSRPSSADTTVGKQPRVPGEKAVSVNEQSMAGGSAAGGLGAWGKSLVKGLSGSGLESALAERKEPQEREQEERGLTSEKSTGLERIELLDSPSTSNSTVKPSPNVAATELTSSAASGPSQAPEALSRSPAARGSGLRIARPSSEAEPANVDIASGARFERSAAIPVTRRMSHGDEGVMRVMPGFGSGTGVFVPGFMNQDPLSLSRSSSPQPAGTGVFLPGLSRTSSGGGGSPSWGSLGRGMMQERGGGSMDQGGSPKFNRLLGVNMEGGSPRMFRQGSPFEGGSPKYFRPSGGLMDVGNPSNFGRMGAGFMEGGSPVYGRASGGQSMGMAEMANFGRPQAQFPSQLEGSSPNMARLGGSVPVSRLARLGGSLEANGGKAVAFVGEGVKLGLEPGNQGGLEPPGRIRTVSAEENLDKKEAGSPGESSVIADILGMEFDPWADGPLPDPSGLAKILLAEERAKAAAAAAKTPNPAAPAARQSRFKFAWESDGSATADSASNVDVRKSRFDFAGSSDIAPPSAGTATASLGAGVKSRFGFTLEGESSGMNTTLGDARPGTASSVGTGSDAGGRFSPAPGFSASDSSETSSRPQSASRPGTADEEGKKEGTRVGVSRPTSASGKPLLPAPPGFVNRVRVGAPTGSQGLLPTPSPFSLRPSLNTPLKGVPPQPPAPPQSADMGFFDPAIMAMGTGKAFEYKPPPSSSPNEPISPGLLSILKNLGGPPSSHGPPSTESRLPFFQQPAGPRATPVRQQQGFGELGAAGFPPPLAGERYGPFGVSSPDPADGSKEEAFGIRTVSGGEAPRGLGVWGSGQGSAAQSLRESPVQGRNQRGGLSSMMAAMNAQSSVPSFANAVTASQPDAGTFPQQGVGTTPLAGQSSWAAIAAVKAPAVSHQESAETEKKAGKEGKRGGTGESEKEGEGFVKGGKKEREEKEKMAGIEGGEGSDGGQEEGEEETGKVLTEEEEKKALRKKEKKLRREREKALAAERKQREAEESKAREKTATRERKSAAAEKDAAPASAPVSKAPEGPVGKQVAANGRAKKESVPGTRPEAKVGAQLDAEERKVEGSKKGSGGEKPSANGKRRKDLVGLEELGRDEKPSEGAEPVLQFARGSDGGPKSPIKEKTKVGLKEKRSQDDKKVAGFEPDALNAAGFLASMATEKKAPGKAVNVSAKGRKDEAAVGKAETSHQGKVGVAAGGENKPGSTPIGVPIGPFGMPVGANMVFGAGSTEFTAQGLGFNLSANQVFPQNWQGSNMNGMAEGIKAGLSLSALLQQQLELQLQQSQPGGPSEGVGGKRSRGYGDVPAGKQDFGLPAAAARAAARVFRMAADFVMDDGSTSSSESFTTGASNRNGRHGNANGNPGVTVNEPPEVYQFSATNSAERAVAAAAAWEQGLRGQEGAVSNGNVHNPLLSQVDALEREVENAREVERKLENKLMEVKQWIDQDDAVLENITSSYSATAAETKGAF